MAFIDFELMVAPAFYDIAVFLSEPNSSQFQESVLQGYGVSDNDL
jgi:hypothetical protein